VAGLRCDRLGLTPLIAGGDTHDFRARWLSLAISSVAISSVRELIDAQMSDNWHEENPEPPPFLEDGSQFGISHTTFEEMEEDDQRELMVQWFYENFEDPANGSVPWDGETKEWLYLWGGPYDAREELGDKFGDIVSEELIDAVVTEIERTGTVDWAPINSSPFYRGDTESDTPASERPGEGKNQPITGMIAEVDPATSGSVTSERGKIDTIDLPDLPSQGPGPQFELTDEGVIDFAPAAALDREGNNVARLRRLHPPLRQLARQSAARLGTGNAPHAILASRVSAYREKVDKDLHTVDFTLLYVEGVRLANADNSAREQIANGELPPLTEVDREAVDTLLQLHGTFMLSTSVGGELLAAERSYQRRPLEEQEHRAAAVDFALSLENRPDIIAPNAAAFVRDAAAQIGQGSNPERSNVMGSSALQNATIVLSAAAAVAALPIMGGFLAGPPGAIAGALTGLLAGEGLKKSTPFATVIAPIIAGLNRAGKVDLVKFKTFLLSVSQKARRLAKGSEQFSWLGMALDRVSEQRGAATAPKSESNSLSDNAQSSSTEPNEVEPLIDRYSRTRAVIEKVFGSIGYVSLMGEYRSTDYQVVSVPLPSDEFGDETSIGFDFVEDYQQRRKGLTLQWWQEFVEAAEVKSEDTFLVVSERPIGFEFEPSGLPGSHIGIKKFPAYARQRIAVLVDLADSDRSSYETTLTAARELLIPMGVPPALPGRQ
jgi:hypothetical protein